MKETIQRANYSKGNRFDAILGKVCVECEDYWTERVAEETGIFVSMYSSGEIFVV